MRLMKKITFYIVVVVFVLMIVGDYWNAYTRKSNQLKIYQEEIANQKEEIRGLEDTVIQLIDRLELYEMTWDVIRGTDSTTIDVLYQYIRWIRDREDIFYEECDYADSKIIA